MLNLKFPVDVYSLPIKKSLKHSDINKAVK